MFQKAMITIVGRVGSEPKLSYSKAGKAILRLRVAVNKRVRNDDGVWEDDGVTWFDVTSFHDHAAAVADVVEKGNMVIVDGRFEMSEWQDKEGLQRSTPTIVADVVSVIPTPKRDDTERGGGGGRRLQSAGSIPF